MNPFGWIATKIKAVVSAPNMAKELYGDVRDAVDSLRYSQEEKNEHERVVRLNFINARIRRLEATMAQNPTRALPGETGPPDCGWHPGLRNERATSVGEGLRRGNRAAERNRLPLGCP